MKLAIAVATMKDGIPPLIQGWRNAATVKTEVFVRNNTAADNLGVIRSYQWLYDAMNRHEYDIAMYAHDDLQAMESDWDYRVKVEFRDPSVAIVGFGGALGHGTDDLYKRPFEIPQLIRIGYRSNVNDAEVHGERFTGAGNAVFCDGFALCIRRSFLDAIGGWSQLIGNVDFIGYDMAICALARRYGWKIRVVGVKCHHYGGGTSVDVGVQQQHYIDAHTWFAKEFVDVLPARVNP